MALLLRLNVTINLAIAGVEGSPSGKFLRRHAFHHRLYIQSEERVLSAKALYEEQRDSTLTLNLSELLCEQNFGAAEGEPKGGWAITHEEQMEECLCPAPHRVDEKYPGGQSIKGIARCAERHQGVTLYFPMSFKLPKMARQTFTSPLSVTASAKQGEAVGHLGIRNTAGTNRLLAVRVPVTDSDTNSHSHLDNIVWHYHSIVYATLLTPFRGTPEQGIGSAAFEHKQKGIGVSFG
ncbi:hypothetical protein BJV78DRAFT_1327733 [Lactifluus subvellereus]|nr:hypothetical protein BJV78DRAFT_1327733 [Lactifluus subvellereus]